MSAICHCILLYEQNSSYAEGASVPALGLSNKAVYHGQSTNLYEDRDLTPNGNGQYSESAFTPIELRGNCFTSAPFVCLMLCDLTAAYLSVWNPIPHCQNGACCKSIYRCQTSSHSQIASSPSIATIITYATW